MADTTAQGYTKADMIRVVDGATGQVLEHPVPKTWLDTELLAPGSKKATAKQVKDADEGGDSSADESDGGDAGDES